MENKWKAFWDEHVESVGSDPYKQVGRTLNGEPMSKEMFKLFANNVVRLLELMKDQSVLDLCCGNGLLSLELSNHCKKVTGVDFNENLVKTLLSAEKENIYGVVSDAMIVDFEKNSFDHIVIAAALQHFSQAQIIQLFKKTNKWLKPKGKLLITDITDNSRIWNFYNSPERVAEYFEQTLNNKSLLGTWFDSKWLKKLAVYTGYNDAIKYDQPKGYWYSHYRFDFLCQK